MSGGTIKQLAQITKDQNKLLIKHICNENSWDNKDLVENVLNKQTLNDYKDVFDQTVKQSINNSITNVKKRGRPKKFRVCGDMGKRDCGDEVEEDFKINSNKHLINTSTVQTSTVETSNDDTYPNLLDISLYPQIINNTIYYIDQTNLNIYDMEKNFIGVFNNNNIDINIPERI